VIHFVEARGREPTFYRKGEMFNLLAVMGEWWESMLAVKGLAALLRRWELHICSYVEVAFA